MSPQILIASLSGQSCCSGFVQVIAIDPEHDFSLTRWLDTEYGVPLGKDGIIIGSTIEGDIGSDLRFYGHPFHITGKLVPTGMGGIDSAVFIRIEDAMVMAAESPEKAVKPLAIPAGMVSWVLVQLEPGASPGDTGMLIRQQMPGIRVITPADLSTTVTGHLSGMILFLHTAAIVVALAAVPVLLIVSVMLAREVNEEVTLLGALGVTRAFVLRLILAESFAASVLGALAGIGAALLVLVAFQDLIVFTLGIPFSIPSLPALILAAGWAFLLTVMLGGLLSLYPTYRVLRSEPVPGDPILTWPEERPLPDSTGGRDQRALFAPSSGRMPGTDAGITSHRDPRDWCRSRSATAFSRTSCLPVRPALPDCRHPLPDHRIPFSAPSGACSTSMTVMEAGRDGGSSRGQSFRTFAICICARCTCFPV